MGSAPSTGMAEAAPAAQARQPLWMTDAQLSGLVDDIEENLKSGVLAPARLACGLCAWQHTLR